jgi:DNA-binding NarL/FixJ family response regulator
VECACGQPPNDLFPTPHSLSVARQAANRRNPNKAKLKETILVLCAQGWSYQEIAREVGLRRTRAEQIVKDIVGK